jgi:epoxyqueuosine reductase QueG
MEHPVLNRIRLGAFVPFGWFAPSDMGDTRFLIIIGNAGPQMFRRFMREHGATTLDEWTRRVVDTLAEDVGAKAVYPFDKPYQPFQNWARACGVAHQSPLGLNIHPTYGLWHAYRAALLFPVVFDLPSPAPSANPCLECEAKPCLAACPVSAFDGRNYDVAACAIHLHSENTCMAVGCKARLACPVGTRYVYEPAQTQFHMNAFKAAHPI